LALLLTYPAGDLVLLFSLSFFALKLRFRRGEPSQLMLLAGLGTMLLADAAFAYQAQAKTYATGGAVDLGYLLVWACLILAAWSGYREMEDLPAPAEHPSLLSVALPHLLLAGILVVFLADLRASLDAWEAQLMLGLGVLLPLVALRQAVFRREDARLQLEHDLLRKENRFQALVEKSADLIFILDEEGYVQFASPSALAVCGLFEEGLENLLSRTHAEDHGRVRGALRRALMSDNHESMNVDVRLMGKDGWDEYELTVSNYMDAEGIEGLLVYGHDVTRRRALQRELQRLALHDPLTGLPNRRLFEDRVAQALRRSDRTGDDVALLFIDLDNFKALNDSLGHAAGDAFLVETAGRIRTELRESDTAARIGGDEMAVLLECGPDCIDALEVAERLLARLRMPWTTDPRVRVSASIGVAVRTKGGPGPSELLAQADAAMYAAKNSGKDGSRLFNLAWEDTCPALAARP
jgi:diguanylate cyclase (GGDEF)-like protein/PAS domain S-box-containing protein